MLCRSCAACAEHFRWRWVARASVRFGVGEQLPNISLEGLPPPRPAWIERAADKEHTPSGRQPDCAAPPPAGDGRCSRWTV